MMGVLYARLGAIQVLELSLYEFMLLRLKHTFPLSHVCSSESLGVKPVASGQKSHLV
jgi:hypothetical protein